jgi:hypothetical protein
MLSTSQVMSEQQRISGRAFHLRRSATGFRFVSVIIVARLAGSWLLSSCWLFAALEVLRFLRVALTLVICEFGIRA